MLHLPINAILRLGVTPPLKTSLHCLQNVHVSPSLLNCYHCFHDFCFFLKQKDHFKNNQQWCLSDWVPWKGSSQWKAACRWSIGVSGCPRRCTFKEVREAWLHRGRRNNGGSSGGLHDPTGRPGAGIAWVSQIKARGLGPLNMVIGSERPLVAGQSWKRHFSVVKAMTSEGHSCETITVYHLSSWGQATRWGMGWWPHHQPDRGSGWSIKVLTICLFH